MQTKTVWNVETELKMTSHIIYTAHKTTGQSEVNTSSHAISCTKNCSDFITWLSLSFSSSCVLTCQKSLCQVQHILLHGKIICDGALPCGKYPGSDSFILFFFSWLGMLCGVWQERHQHEQAGGHFTGGKIPRFWHEDPAPYQRLRLGFWKGN